MEPSTFFKQVNGWCRDFDDHITALRADLDTFNVKEVGRVATSILEAESLAVALILKDQVKPLELAAVRVQVEREDAKRAIERDRGGRLTGRVVGLNDLKLAPVTRDFGDERPVCRSAGSQQED